MALWHRDCPSPNMYNKQLGMSRHTSRPIWKGSIPYKKRGENLFPLDYAPKKDVTPLLDHEVTTYYMQCIGILRWMCELRPIDICTKVSMLSSYSCNAFLHVFKSNLGESDFVECDWSDFYPGASEALPPKVPKPLGNGVTQ
eukprot:CCRYP_017418-RA/>CCRYP_017418-RA protein AED:0.40 eAED:0.54 QI:0/0/0/1/0/0/2/0/141